MIELCEDAGFVKTVALGQFCITRDAGEFSEFDGHVGCREFSLRRDEESSTPKGWSREDTKINLVLEVVTNYHHGKPGIEIGIASLSGDESHSLVRISKGLNKLVRNLTERTRTLGDDEVDFSKHRTTCCTRNENRKTFSNGSRQTGSKTKAKPTSCPIS